MMADLRMPDLNRVMLAGRLTRDPELRTTASGMEVANLGLAVSRTWKDKDGKRQEESMFIDATAWGKTAEFVARYFAKGEPVLVEGRLRHETWESDGGKRSKHTVTVDRIQGMAWAEDGGDKGPEESTAGGGNQPKREENMGDNLPF